MNRLRWSLAVGLAGALAACAVTPAGPTVEEPTPTPEIFLPLDPSPTPASSDLPLTCQVTDLPVAVNAAGGYCLAYPAGFALDETGAADDGLRLAGAPLDDGPEPLQVTLDVSAEPAPAGSDLAGLVDTYLAANVPAEAVPAVERSERVLGGVPATVLEDVPGRLSARVVLALHGGTLFTLRFHPSDVTAAAGDLDDLFTTVTGSFAFLEDA